MSMIAAGAPTFAHPRNSWSRVMNDLIVDEIRRIRDARAAQFNYDLDAMFRDLKEQERKSGLKFVRGVARQNGPDQSGEPTGPPVPVSDPSLLSRSQPTL
jgi:hypothetical protein